MKAPDMVVVGKIVILVEGGETCMVLATGVCFACSVLYDTEVLAVAPPLA